MDENVKDGFQYIKQSKIELDNIVMGRNEIAKWTKLNSLTNKSHNSQLFSKVQSYPEYEDLNTDEKLQFDQSIENLGQLVKYPPMIRQKCLMIINFQNRQINECKYCFARNVCSITALSFESQEQRKPPVGQFPTFLDLEKSLQQEVKAYYKKFVEIIQIEQNTENDRLNQQLIKNIFIASII